MPNSKRLKIWGRANSVNVQKVLWCLGEIDLAYERIDAGKGAGRLLRLQGLALRALVQSPLDGNSLLRAGDEPALQHSE